MTMATKFSKIIVLVALFNVIVDATPSFSRKLTNLKRSGLSDNFVENMVADEWQEVLFRSRGNYG